ncbi:GNAT family N-acetyltransferase [Chitinibacter sp. SCUT-21]|uniref:GNAT family N-acetyltransferase n=1 Tax=Chitinibacter sp. SCUT-21 TaxID=2970891 RepID=UPI0035A6AFDA
MTLIIRPIQAKDLAIAHQVMMAAATAGETNDQQELLAYLSQYHENVSSLLSGPDLTQAITLVAQMGNDIVGVAQLNGDGEIKLFYVTPEWQGRGIGRALLAELALNAQCSNIQRLQIYTSNAARLFFLAHGFHSEDKTFSEWLTADLTKWKILYEQQTTH